MLVMYTCPVSTLLWCVDAEMGSCALQTRYLLQRNTVSIMKGFEENISKKLSRFISCILYQIVYVRINYVKNKRK